MENIIWCNFFTLEYKNERHLLNFDVLYSAYVCVCMCVCGCPVVVYRITVLMVSCLQVYFYPVYLVSCVIVCTGYYVTGLERCFYLGGIVDRLGWREKWERIDMKGRMLDVEGCW